MNYLITAVLVMAAVLIIAFRVILAQRRKNKELKTQLKKEEKIEKQKDKIDTGNDTVDFDSTIDLLHEYSKRKH